MSKMRRADFIKYTGIGATAISLAPGLLSSRADGKKPNILFIMSDDHAANGISAYGSKINQTPNIDRLANEGMRFDNCYCINSICTPSRATILTGKYGHINGTDHLDMKFDGSQVTFPKLMQEAGYYTAIVGKWHLGTEPTGFDYYNILPQQGRYFDPYLKESGKPWADGVGGGERYDGYVTDVIADQVMKCLDERPEDKPFCLLYHNKAPHDMWDYHPKYENLYADEDVPAPESLFEGLEHRSTAHERNLFQIGVGDLSLHEWTGHLKGDERKQAQYQIFIKRFLRCVASVDENLGRVLDYLDNSGLAENTIVIYTSDQGAFLGEHGLWDKRMMYEESIRMPFIVRYSRGIKPGTVNNDIVSNLDFAETFVDYAGVKVPGDMQGRSLKPLFEGNRPGDWRESFYYHYSDSGTPPPQLGVRTDRFKLIYYYGLAEHFEVNDPFRITFTSIEPEWELYDLKQDPREMHNVYDDPAYAEVVVNLKEELRRLRKQYGDDGDGIQIL